MKALCEGLFGTEQT